MKTKAQQLGITKFPYFEFDDNTLTYLETQNGFWWGRKYGNNGNETYVEWRDGTKQFTII
tara:strand:- start:2034 stop:2213 length:180 start_codon:yes stop_codon:yes gene_type:complete